MHGRPGQNAVSFRCFLYLTSIPCTARAKHARIPYMLGVSLSNANTRGECIPEYGNPCKHRSATGLTAGRKHLKHDIGRLAQQLLNARERNLDVR